MQVAPVSVGSERQEALVERRAHESRDVGRAVDQGEIAGALEDEDLERGGVLRRKAGQQGGGRGPESVKGIEQLGRAAQIEVRDQVEVLGLGPTPLVVFDRAVGGATARPRIAASAHRYADVHVRRPPRRASAGWEAGVPARCADVHVCKPSTIRSAMRCMAAQAPTDGDVVKAAFAEHRGVVQVAPVEDHGLPQRGLHGVEVGTAEFVPLGDHGQRVGVLKRFLRGRAQSTRSGRSPYRRLASPRAWGSYARTRPPAAQIAAITARLGASRMSSVFGLNASPHSAMVLPRKSPK